MIGQTLAQIFDQQTSSRLEVVLVDSGSDDQTLEIAQRFPVRIFKIAPDSFSYGYALNYGIAQAEGTVICNLSAHCVPVHSSWLEELTAPILNGQADATYGRQIPVKGVNAWEEYQLHKLFREDDRQTERAAFSNANCAFLRTLWKELKFDEEIPRWEDYLWYLLLKGRYRFSYCSRAEVRHTHPFGLRPHIALCYKDGKTVRLFQKKYGIHLWGKPDLSNSEKIRMILQDVCAHGQFFLRAGYLEELLKLPFVNLAGYLAYFYGYQTAAEALTAER